MQQRTGLNTPRGVDRCVQVLATQADQDICTDMRHMQDWGRCEQA